MGTGKIVSTVIETTEFGNYWQDLTNALKVKEYDKYLGKNIYLIKYRRSRRGGVLGQQKPRLNGVLSLTLCFKMANASC